MALTEDEYNNEIEQLKNISLVDIVKYIKDSIDAIVSFKVEDLMDEYKSKKDGNSATDYETLLQKEEASIRQHISYEHQIKIEYEKIMDKYEMLDLENKLFIYQSVSKKFLFFLYIQEKQKEEYEKEIEKLKKEISDNELKYIKKEKELKELKELLEQKENEIKELKSKFKLLNSNNVNNENNANNNSNISLLLKSKANSSIYTTSKDDVDSNKYKYDDFNNVYKEKTMSNFNQSRNNNLFTLLNRHKIKNNNINQSNTIININSYLSKNYSTNNLKKNNSSRKRNYMNTSKKQNYKLHFHNNSSFNITNNTYNMNKNNIMINLNPKNVNMNMEKMKVQKKLLEYQSLIDQKLNELMKKKNPHIKNRQASFHLRQNSSPNVYIRNLKYPQKKFNLSTLDYYFKKSKKKKLTRNSSEVHYNRGSKMIDSKSVVETFQKRKISQDLNSKSQSIRNEKVNSENINNIKYSLNREKFNKLNEFNNLKYAKQKNQNNDSGVPNEKTNISLRKFIFAKCGKPIANIINNKHNIH